MQLYFQNLAFFNRWSNERLFKSLKTEDHLKPEIPALLKKQIDSEELWFSRLQNSKQELIAVQPEIVYLERRRRSLDEDWIDLLEIEIDFRRTIEYQTITQPSVAKAASVERIFSHIFDSQTFARGQICTYLAKPPPLEMIHFSTGV